MYPKNIFWFRSGSSLIAIHTHKHFVNFNPDNQLFIVEQKFRIFTVDIE